MGVGVQNDLNHIFLKLHNFYKHMVTQPRTRNLEYWIPKRTGTNIQEMEGANRYFSLEGAGRYFSTCGMDTLWCYHKETDEDDII